jgi:hypothetical protein
VRVFQQFATVDLLSGGRAEIMAGRGSFIESFPLFGYDLADYDGSSRRSSSCCCAASSSLSGARAVASASTRGPCRSRCRCGSRSAARPSRRPRRAARAADGARDHRRAAGALRPRSPSSTAEPRRETGTSRRALSINSHGFVAESSEQAAEDYFVPLQR